MDEPQVAPWTSVERVDWWWFSLGSHCYVLPETGIQSTFVWHTAVACWGAGTYFTLATEYNQRKRAMEQ